MLDRLLSIRNDLGLLAEEYDTVNGRLIGNFPQAFSHVGLINTAFNLTRATRPAEQRAKVNGSHVQAPAATQEAAASRPRPREDGRAGRPSPRQASSAFFRSSLTALGLALPPVDFMTWPTNQPNRVGLAL